MSAIQQERSPYRISIVDEDPLRARREARELLGELSGADPTAALDVPQARAAGELEKGGGTPELIGLLFSGGALVVAGVQTWLARVPQRTVVATRPDGATLRITGREAREDDLRIERFLAGGEADQESAGGTDDEDTGPAVG